MKHSSLSIFTLLFLMSQNLCWAETPEFINHPKPTLARTNNAPFALLEETKSFECLGNPTVLEWFSALTPKIPLASCTRRVKSDTPEESCFSFGGGLMRVCFTYLTKEKGKIALLASKKAFIEKFAPVETPEEAIAFATVLTTFMPMYGLALDPKATYLVDSIEDTHTIPEGDGYLLNLFSKQHFGCGPFYTREVTVHVKRDGTVTADKPRDLFHDGMAGLCVD